jgi:hypothetical protein
LLHDIPEKSGQPSPFSAQHKEEIHQENVSFKLLYL